MPNPTRREGNVRWFDITVNDILRMDMSQGAEERFEVINDIIYFEGPKVFLFHISSGPLLYAYKVDKPESLRAESRGEWQRLGPGDGTP